jgi:NitT/TauT family transport system ATP-binding protein
MTAPPPAPDDSVAPVVAARGVAKTYPNGTHALAPVDIRVRRGELVTLLGPSGCGKSTLLNLFAGLIDPTDGEMRWWGGALGDTGGAGRRFGYVFQSPTLMPWARVAANVRLPLDLLHVPRAEAEGRAADALALVGLEGFARHYPRELSGGMQMRVSIARALVTEPDLLLMDEPFGALDEFTRNRLDDELVALWSARRLTVVFVTHSIHEAAYLSTRVVVMAARPGRVLADVPVEHAHPRGDAFRASAAYGELCARLSRLAAAAGAQEAERA